MLAANLERILGSLPDSARVVDVGGWAAPLNRADWVIDLMPHDSRGALISGGFGPGPERFSADRWVRRDLCDPEPYPFEDDYFDYAVCTFTLEDIRDPIRVCREMSRIARAGYVEVPSLVDELTWRVAEPSGGPWAGHLHHRWLCTEDDGGLAFLSKFHSLHSDPRTHVPPRWAAGLSEEQRVLALFWEGELRACERAAITEYPVDELEREILATFGESRAALLAENRRQKLREIAGGVRRKLAQSQRRWRK